MKNIEKSQDALIFQNKFYDSDTGKLLSPIELQNYTVIQVAESNYLKNFIIAPHFQYCDLEITFPLTNGLICQTDGDGEQVNKNELYLSFSGDTHTLFSRRSCRFQTLAINVKSGSCASILEKIRTKFHDCRVISMADITPYMSAVISEFLAPDRCFFLNNLDSLITGILVRLARFGSDDAPNSLLSTDNVLPDIINYIDSHYLDICTLDELSGRFGYSYSHICRQFKKLYKLSPSEYLWTKRMEHAAAELRKGVRISQIAEQLGYSTAYNFSRAFKKHFGLPPGQYRKNA